MQVFGVDGQIFFGCDCDPVDSPRQSDVAPGIHSSHTPIIQLTMAVKTPIVKKRTKPFKCAL